MQKMVAGFFEAIGWEFSLEVGLAAFFLVFVVQMGLFYLRERQLAMSLAHVRLWFRQRLSSAIFASDWPYFLRQRKGDLVSGVLLECNNAGSAFQHVLKLLTSVALIVVYSAAGLWMSWEVTVGMLVLGVLLTVVLQGQIRAGEDLGTRKTTVNSRFQNVIGESLDSAKLIKGSSLENLAVGLILDEAEQLADIERNVHIKHAKLRVLW